MDTKKTGALIARVRKEKGLSQIELAQLLGVTNKAASRWETGRGYPDIELWPQLCRVLEISVKELMDGELSTQVKTREPVNPNVEMVCQHAARQNKRQSRTVVILCVALVLLAAICAGFYLSAMARTFARTIIGAEYCVIEQDYSSLTYCDQTYIPLPMDGYECTVGERIVSEAQAENVGFWESCFLVRCCMT